MNEQTDKQTKFSFKPSKSFKNIYFVSCFLFVCLKKKPLILFRNKPKQARVRKRLCQRSEDVSSTVDPLINAWTHLILDTSHESFVPPVHSVWQALARISNKEVWLPLEVSGGSECGQSLADLVQGLKGNKRFEMNCQRNKIRKRHIHFGEILRGRKSFFPWCPA